MEEAMRKEIMELVEQANAVVVCSVNEEGYPNAKGMLNLKHDSIRTFWFSTNLSSRRTAQFQYNPKASVYVMNEQNYQGLLLTGEMEVLTDRESRAMMWRDGFEIYYPQGIDDKDYCVFRFMAKTGNYYHGLKNTSFEV
jgi:general stress protein 26